MIFLNVLQRKLAAWQTKNFGKQDPDNALLGAGEELGELFHARLKSKQGIRGHKHDFDAKGKDAVGDCMIFLMQYCSSQGWDIESILKDTAREVLARDWKRFPGNGAER